MALNDDRLVAERGLHLRLRMQTPRVMLEHYIQNFRPAKLWLLLGNRQDSHPLITSQA